MKQLGFVLIFTLMAGLLNAQELMGFSEANSAKQLDWEKQFDV